MRPFQPSTVIRYEKSCPSVRERGRSELHGVPEGGKMDDDDWTRVEQADDWMESLQPATQGEMPPDQ